MSKSLKNFITIKDALQKYTSRQIRILFLLHSWKDTLDYSDHGMDGALSFEKTMKEFFFRVKDFTRNSRFDVTDGYVKCSQVEVDLLKL
jgi:cysteinyl-tRNA synthetase